MYSFNVDITEVELHRLIEHFTDTLLAEASKNIPDGAAVIEALQALSLLDKVVPSRSPDCFVPEVEGAAI